MYFLGVKRCCRTDIKELRGTTRLEHQKISQFLSKNTESKGSRKEWSLGITGQPACLITELQENKTACLKEGT